MWREFRTTGTGITLKLPMTTKKKKRKRNYSPRKRKEIRTMIWGKAAFGGLWISKLPILLGEKDCLPQMGDIKALLKSLPSSLVPQNSHAWKWLSSATWGLRNLAKSSRLVWKDKRREVHNFFKKAAREDTILEREFHLSVPCWGILN